MGFIDQNRFFPAEEKQKKIAQEIYSEIKNLPIISPHGHTDPSWYAKNINFSDAATLFIKPDHYVHRMLYSQGISLDELGIPTCNDDIGESDNLKIWKIFADHYHLYIGTPCQMWLDTVFSDIFGLEHPLTSENATQYYNHINQLLQSPEYKVHHLLKRFNIELIATTEDALDPLLEHQKIQQYNLSSRIITTFRPDSVTNPESLHFFENIQKLGTITNEDTNTYQGYIKALENRRSYFKKTGHATATDHGFPTAFTIELSDKEAQSLYHRILTSKNPIDPKDAEIFRGHILMKMAEMSIDDGLVMQLHAGVYRNHNPLIFQKWGADKGADIPEACEYTRALKPLLNKFGNDKRFSMIIFTLDEDAYSRELAPLAGYYPALKLGPPWWFHDSPEGMIRYRERMTETAGFFNTAGFNDDTRAFLSIPARHDMARRMDAVWLSRLVSKKRISHTQAHFVAKQLTTELVKKAYKL